MLLGQHIDPLMGDGGLSEALQIVGVDHVRGFAFVRGPFQHGAVVRDRFLFEADPNDILRTPLPQGEANGTAVIFEFFACRSGASAMRDARFRGSMRRLSGLKSAYHGSRVGPW